MIPERPESDALAERLREIAARLRDPETPDEEVESLAREAADLAGRAAREIESFRQAGDG